MKNMKCSLKPFPTSVQCMLDTGNPKLNSTLDTVFKLGGVGAAHAALQEAFGLMRKEVSTRHDLEKIVKKASKEGLQWGLVTGIYAGIGYTMDKVRGKHDWKNAALGGALTGALLSVGDGRFNQDKMFRTTLTAGALATASEFLKIL